MGLILSLLLLKVHFQFPSKQMTGGPQKNHFQVELFSQWPYVGAFVCPCKTFEKIAKNNSSEDTVNVSHISTCQWEVGIVCTFQLQSRCGVSDNKNAKVEAVSYHTV